MKTLKRGIRWWLHKFVPKVFNLIVIFGLVLQPVGPAGVYSLALAIESESDLVAPAVEESVPAPDPVEEEAAPTEEPAEEPVTDITADTVTDTGAITDTGTTTDIGTITDTNTDTGIVTTIDTGTDTDTTTDTGTTTETGTTTDADTTAPTGTTVTTDAPTITEQPIDGAITPEAAETPADEPAEAPVSEEPAVEEIPTTLVEPVIADGPVVEDTVCLSASVEGDSEGNWHVDEENDTAETDEPVQLGVRYIFPLDKEVTVTFTCLPSDKSKRAPLKIERIDASAITLPEGVVAATEYAYDITTEGMDNGDFKYDLTLPKSDVEGAEVKFIEQSADEVVANNVTESELKSVDEKNVEEETDSVTVSDLDHFTVFVVTANQTVTSSSVETPDNGWVSDNNYATFNSSGDTADYGFPDIAVPVGAIIDGIEVLIEGNTTGRNLTAALWNTSNSTPDDYTSTKTASLSGSDTIQTLGGPTDKWGKTWTSADFADATFKVKIGTSGGGSSIASLDQVQVKVYYNQSINWPTSWSAPNSCVTDPSGESGVSPSEVDLVGNTSTPAVGFASDANYFYFRERVNGNPGTVSNLDQYSWVVLLQTATPQYQYLAAISGKSGNKVLLYDNPTHSPSSGGVDFSPLFNDPADNVVWEGSSSDYGRITSSGGKYYIDWAIPVAELTSRGVSVSTTKFFATSTNANNYNKDNLQCYTAFADLSIVKSDSPDPVTNGGTLTYTLAIHNGGPDTASSVVVNDTLPTGFAVTSVTPSTGSCSDVSAPTIQCELGNMVNGADTTVTIVGTITTAETSITNTATVELDETQSLDLDQANNSDSEVTAVNQKGHLIVQKTTLPAPDLTLFAINTTGTGTISIGGAGTVSDSSDMNYEVTAGTYSVAETVPTGWAKVGDTCQNVVVAAGATVTCLLTNAKQGSITIIKDAQPNDAQDFAFSATGDGVGSFSLDDDSDATLLNTTSFNNLDPGSFSFTEATTTGWSLANISCVDTKQPTGSINGSTASLTLAAGQSITCTYTNTKKGHIIVNKVTDPAGSSQSFDFTTSGTGYSGFSLTDAATPNDQEVTPGSYSVSEGAVTGWDSDGGVCDNGETPASLDVEPGETVTCVFTNTKRGNITIVKDAQPNNALDFTFNNNFGNSNPSTFSLDDDSNATLLNTRTFEVLPGTYAVSENSVAGWQQESQTCDSGETIDSIDVAPGETVTCTFVNEKYAKIKLVKKTIGGNDTFDFDATGAGLPTDIDLTTVGGTATQTFSNLDQDNTYTIVENVPDGWDLTSAICDKGETIGSIDLEPGETVTCTFTNTKRGSITIVKDAQPNGAQDFQFEGDLDPGTFSLDDDSDSTLSNTQVFNNLESDKTYTISESNAGLGNTWDLTSIDCTGGSDVNTNERNVVINLLPGENVICTFVNEQRGLVSGSKFQDDNANGQWDEGEPALADWTIFIDENKNGILDDGETSTVTDADGNYSFADLKKGDYTVCEQEQEGWTRSYPAESNCQTMTVEKGESTPNIDFGNYPNGTIHGYKWDDQDENGDQDGDELTLAGWTINLYESDGDGGYNPEPIDSMVTDSGSEHFGWYWFEHLFPGEYKVCEVPQTGWNQTYPDNEGEDCHLLFLPDDNSNDFPESENYTSGPEYNFGNHFTPPALQISKDNDSGAPEIPGNSVFYTITVTAPEGNATNVEDVEVTDLPPAGFTYQGGSWTASSTNGSHIGLLELTHIYASPGVWSLGTMIPGEVVTLTYAADISGSQDAGTYNDLAFAQGKSIVNETDVPDVTANASESTPFVGTDVEVILPASSVEVALTNTVERDVDTKTITRTKTVLGAATTLPYTGASISTILFALMTLLGGLILLLLSKQSTWNLIRSLSRSMTKVFLFAVVAGGILFAGQSVSAAPGDLNVQIEQPKAVINSPEFKVGFVVLDISADDPIDVECEVAYEAGTFGEFDTYTIAAGGGSGDCDVDAVDMPADGTYTFRVTAEEQGDSDSDIATAAPIELVSGAPSTPLNYSRTSCTAGFTTADDGLTDVVELYRSLSSTFTADASTLVMTSASIGPNVASTLADPNGDCGGSYFYAIRAVAASGLASGFVGDENVVIDNENEIKYKTKIKKVAGPTTVLGAIPVTGGGASTEGTVEGAATTGEETVSETGTGAEGSVLGAMNEGAAGFWDWIKNHPWWTALWILILIALGYYAYQTYLRKHNEDHQPR